MTAPSGATSTNSGTSPATSRAAHAGTFRISPRLDWQMWFAALDDPRRLPWFSRFLERLLENQPTVTTLLQKNPFPDKPPNYVRAQFYDYTYASGKEKREGRWWDRRLLGLYFPAVRLKGE